MSTEQIAPSPLLSWPGAAPQEGPDAGTAAHYGDPQREQALLDRGVGLVDRSTRGVLAVPGADRLSWLHSLTTQALDRLPVGRALDALVLSPHGHVEHAMTVDDDGTTTWLETEPGAAGALLEHLRRMQFMLRVDPRDATADRAVLTVGGPGAGALLAPLLPGGVAPEAGQVVAGPADGTARGVAGPLVEQVDLRVPRGALAEVADALRAAGAAPVGSWAYTALRVAAVVPRVGLESDHRTLPHELGLIGAAVHLDKGCYRGQETVARVHNLGRPPRRLVLLQLDGSEVSLPAVGAPVTAAGRTVGVVGSSGRHHELGPVALALVKRNLAVETVLEVDGLAAAIDADVTPTPVEERRLRPAERLAQGLGPESREDPV